MSNNVVYESNPVSLPIMTDLLSDSGIISQAEKAEALELSSVLKFSIDKTLVMCGFINARIISLATQLLSLLHNGKISLESCLSALKICHDSGRELEDVLLELSGETQTNLSANNISDLLLSAGLVDNQSLAKAMYMSKTSGAGLFRSLLQLNLISETMIWSVLDALVLMRDWAISQQQAVLALKESEKRQLTLEQTLEEQGIKEQSIRKGKMRLGELLTLSGVLNEKTLLDALELALTQNCPLGIILLEREIIGIRILERSLQIQKLVEEGLLTPTQSVEALQFSIENRTSVSRTILELGFLKMTYATNIKLGDLLKSCGVLTEENLNDALRLSLKNSTHLGQMLLLTEQIDALTLNNALECQSMLRAGAINLGQAVIALNYCLRTRCSLNQAISELGWSENMETQTKCFQDILKNLDTAPLLMKAASF